MSQGSAEIVVFSSPGHPTIPPGWSGIKERHPVRINGQDLVIEHLTIPLAEWEADPELRATFRSAGTLNGYVRAIRVLEDDGARRLRFYDPGRN